jgi:hypothetical protein
VKYEVRSAPGEDYEGRQYGYQIWRLPTDDETFPPYPEWTATTGSTGPCWNIDSYDPMNQDDDGTPLHVCDLDDLIEALQALASSDADHKHQERWS